MNTGLKAALACLSLLLLTACAVGPDYRRPADAAPAAHYGAAGASETYREDAPSAEFWTAFGDPLLNRLVKECLAANHDMRIALAHLNEARALLNEVRYDSLPTVTAQAGHTRALQSTDEALAHGANTARSVRETSLSKGGIDAYWELDLFGRTRRAIEAGEAGEQALDADLRDVQTSVAAELARAYFELRGAQEALSVSRRNAENQQATAAYAQARLDAGSGTEFDTSRAQAQLNATLATVPVLEMRVVKAIHRIAVLCGQQPDALNALLETPAALPQPPRLTGIGKPADLLRRRPDIRAAERRLAAATAEIGVATADLFPRVSFTGEIGFSVSKLSHAGEAVGETWYYGPGIHWAAFDLGRVQARIAQNQARTDAALATYQQTVLRAFEETENALAGYGRARQRLGYLAASMSASEHASELARTRFEAGASEFLDVLSAGRAQLDAEAQYSEARTEVSTELVALYKALGGDWSW